MRGLIIKKEWLDLILSGKKTIEVRSSKTSCIGETIYLLESKTHLVRGTCKIQKVEKLDETKWNETKDKHLVPCEFNQLPYKKSYGWYLQDVTKLDKEFSYSHPKGAVIWVKDVH